MDGYEEYYEASGSLQPLEENETMALFRDMEHELEVLTQRYHVPPEDLEQLFQVVQSMFDFMDSTKEALDRTEIEKNELEELWKQEKDKLRAAQRKKLELECRLEEERMKIESEKTTLEKDKVSLQTKLKQLGEQKESAEHELQRIKERTEKEEEIRKDLLEQYKKQADIIQTQTLKRKGSHTALSSRKLPATPYQKHPTSSHTVANHRVPPFNDSLEDSIRSDSFLLGSAEIPTDPFQTVSPTNSLKRTTHIPSQAPNTSLQDELNQAQEAQGLAGQEAEPPLPPQNGEELEESQELGEEGVWAGLQDTEGTSLMEEMFLNTPMRAEVEMLQREKELWAEERKKMEEDVRVTREDREKMERQQAETQVEVRQLRENLRKLQEDFKDVKAERDEILSNYLEQPFDEYCITKKELNELLKKQQKTAIELQLEKEEKEKLQKLLASKRSFFERFKEKWRRMFTKPVSDEAAVLYKSQQTQGLELEKMRTLSPIPAPLVRSLAPMMNETLMVERGWLMSHDSHMARETLPYWMGQVILQGIDIERIDDVAVGRVFHSPVQPFPGNTTPPRMRVGGRKSSEMAMKLLAGVQQLHAEVWLATCEGSASHIEIIDVLAKPPKVRQRFMVRPKTKRILCMKSIPGVVAQSRDFTDSTHLSKSTAWVESSFIGHRQPGFTQSMIVGGTNKKRPRSAPQRRQTYSNDYVGSSPDLSSCSEPGPLELFSSNRLHPQAAAYKPRPEETKFSESFGNSLSPIKETDSAPKAPPSVIVTPEPNLNQNGGLQRASFVVTDEDTDFDVTPSNEPNISSTSITSIEGESSRFSEVTSTPVSTVRTNHPLPISPLHLSHSNAPSPGSESPLLRPRSNTPGGQDEGTDGRGEGQEEQRHPVVWMVTESSVLYFFPTTPPSHKPFNSVQLHAPATCIEYIEGKVFIGHSNSTLSVYYIDEFSHTWDIENPNRISFPSPDKEVYEVQCIAVVKDRVWVGVGSSIFFVDPNPDIPSSMCREGSIFLDSWRRKPRQILPLEDIVVVTTTSTCLYIFDANSARLIQKININSIAKLLDCQEVCDPKNSRSTPLLPPTITRIVSDDTNLYIGTSYGKMVAVPIASLMSLREKLKERVNSPVVSMSRSVSLSPTHKSGNVSPKRKSVGTDEPDGLFNRNKKVKEKKKNRKSKEVEAPKEEKKDKKDEEWEELRTAEAEDFDEPYLENTAISLHSLNDSEVQNLVHLRLPDNQVSKLKPNNDPIPYHSMPNLNSPFGGRVPISPPIVTYKTVILSAGKGHMEYIVEEDREAIQESITSAIRERNEAFQMLAWGHKNVLP